MRVRAHAKINLSLRVLGTRPDGYHELRTIFQAIALHDTLTIRRARGPFRLTCDDLACPVDESNLVWKAAAALWRASGQRGAPRDVAVDLVKRIPMQAGLGGGSSDAAAALRALCALWRVKASIDELRHAAGMLGADVPYFLEGGTALGLHRGDLLFPLDDIAPAWAVVVVPAFGVSTKEAFAWWDEEVGVRAAGVSRTKAPNDLQRVVAKRHPVVSQLVRALAEHGAFHAALSGSGSAVFGLFTRQAAARRAARVLAGPRTFVTPTLTRAACRRLAAG